MNKIVAFLLTLTLVFSLSACSGTTGELTAPALAAQPLTEIGTDSAVAVNANNSENASTLISVKYDSDDLETSLNSADITNILLAGNSITLDGRGATVDGNIVTITSAGVYSLSGVLDDGQIIVDTEDQGTVTLVLNEADITFTTGAPIYISQAEKTIITLTAGTENYVTDGASYTFADEDTDEPDAAIFSKDDLTINGTGSLTVQANYNDGLTSKDNLKITGGTITINAVNDGIKGKDSIAIKDGTVVINAGGDGMQTTNDSDADQGYIVLEGGTLNIIAGLDGVQAETNLLVSGGNITIVSGGGNSNSSSGDGWGFWGSNDASDTASAKGLKAGVDVTIAGGITNINSSDDAIHSNDSMTINGGEMTLAAGDDGLHADSTLEINGGNLTITQSYEGLESAIIKINDGAIHLTASDDGINVAGGNDGSAGDGRPGQDEFSTSGDYYLYINGGYLYVDAGGDGLDSNGSFDMTDGVVIVNGPTNNGNGPLDYNGTFNITGGFLVAVGSSGMAQAPSASSTQYSMIHNFTSTQAAGTMVHLETDDGTDILSFVPTKEYQSVVLSSPELENGTTYRVYTGGSSSGTATDGLYAGGVYTAGTEVTSLTISSIVTGADSLGGHFPGATGGDGPPPGGGKPRQF